MDIKKKTSQANNEIKDIKLDIDDSNISTTYANAVRTNATAEELILEFGVNIPKQETPECNEVIFHLDNRIIMNYYSAKRLALALGQHLRKYEEIYGNIEIDPNKRVIKK